MTKYELQSTKDEQRPASPKLCPSYFVIRTSNYVTLTDFAYNNQGQLLQQTPVVMDGGRVAVDISAEARGVYHAVTTSGKKSYSGKIVFR